MPTNQPFVSTQNKKNEMDDALKEVDQALKKLDELLSKRVGSINRTVNKINLPRNAARKALEEIFKRVIGDEIFGERDNSRGVILTQTGDVFNPNSPPPTSRGGLKTSTAQIIADLANSIFKANQRNL